jgi:hypothetical protein
MDEPAIAEMIRHNPRDVVDRQYKKRFRQRMIQMYKEDKDFQNILMQESALQDRVIGFFLDRAIREVFATREPF